MGKSKNEISGATKWQKLKILIPYFVDDRQTGVVFRGFHPLSYPHNVNLQTRLRRVETLILGLKTLSKRSFCHAYKVPKTQSVDRSTLKIVQNNKACI